MNLTAQKITAEALLRLRASGARVRRVNNVGAYKKRANQVEPGWPDVQGYSSQGIIILLEVKTKGDTLKPEQNIRLQDCHDCGGLSFVATENKGVTVIYPFTEYINL